MHSLHTQSLHAQIACADKKLAVRMPSLQAWMTLYIYKCGIFKHYSLCVCTSGGHIIGAASENLALIFILFNISVKLTCKTYGTNSAHLRGLRSSGLICDPALNSHSCGSPLLAFKQNKLKPSTAAFHHWHCCRQIPKQTVFIWWSCWNYRGLFHAEQT